MAGDRGQEIRKPIPAPSKGCYKPVWAAVEFKPPNAVFNFLVAMFQTRREKPSWNEYLYVRNPIRTE